MSSLLGIVIGDSLWLWALGALGAEQTILLTALQPFLAAMVGWAMLGQTPGARCMAAWRSLPSAFISRS